MALGEPFPAASNEEEHLMRAVYLAVRYSRHPEMRRVRDELLARGYVVTSRWIDQHDGALPDSLDHVALNSNLERGGLFAQVDMDDLAAADTVVSFTSVASGGKGSRHVEFGLVLGLGKHLVVIGPRENVLHTLPVVERHVSWEAFLAAGVPTVRAAA